MIGFTSGEKNRNAALIREGVAEMLVGILYNIQIVKTPESVEEFIHALESHLDEVIYVAQQEQLPPMKDGEVRTISRESKDV